MVEINDDIRGAYSPNKKVRCKTAMVRSGLCGYSDAYILVKENTTVNNIADAGAAANNTNEKVIFTITKTNLYVPVVTFTNCIRIIPK